MNKTIRLTSFVVFIMLLSSRLFAFTPLPSCYIIELRDTLKSDTLHLKINAEAGTAKFFRKMDEEKRKKLVAALFAFPFPFGFMGAHRVMLGSKPWIPVVYVATFGGCFGLIPLIDFIAIVFTKDLSQYENNPHVFMWLK